jgi:hypothetical protein
VRRDGAICWNQVSHAYGPAIEVPGWIAGLRDPGAAVQCLSELYSSITHQGSRHSATPLTPNSRPPRTASSVLITPTTI